MRPPWRVLLVGAGVAGLAFETAAQQAAAAIPGMEILAFNRAAIIAVVALIAVSAFVAAGETAFFSLHKVRVRQMAGEDRRSSRLLRYLSDVPERLRTTLLLVRVGLNAAMVVMLSGGIAFHLIEDAALFPWAAYTLAIIATALAFVIFVEILPKVLVVPASEHFARIAAYPFVALVTIFGMLHDGLSATGRYIMRAMGWSHGETEAPPSDEEIEYALSDSEKEGILDEEERAMIKGILKSGDALLREILIPRPDIVAVSEDTTLEEALNLYREGGYSRMPVYRDDLDHVTGILFVKDLLPRVIRGDLERKVREIARQPMWVPETMTVQGFVRSAQRRHTHLAIVVDEYGGTEGIVTLEDAMEEVVGEIHDENEQEVAYYEHLDNGQLRVQGKLPLHQLSNLIGVPFESNEHETVGGFLMGETDKILEENDVVEHEGVKFVVETMDGKRVSTLRVSPPEPAKQEAAQ